MSKVFSIPVEKIDIVKINNSDFLKLRMYVISDGVNLNGSCFVKEGFEDGIETMYNKPILAYYNKEINDVEEHNSQLTIDEFGNEYYDYQYDGAEKPVGMIPESSKIYISKKDKKNWIVIDGALIWTEYNKQLVNLLSSKKNKKISVEVEFLDVERKDEVDYIYKWKFLGVTLLGKYPDGEEVREGISGAHLLVKNPNYEQSAEFATFKKKMSFALNQIDGNDILDKYRINTNVRRKNMSLSHRDLEDRIWAELSGYTYEERGYTNHKYWVEDVLEDEKKVVVKDNETGERFLIPYSVDDENKVHVDISEKKPASKNYKEFSSKPHSIEVFLAKNEWGTGDIINIDKSKDAVSDTSWGSVNKTNLRNEILKAKNYRTLVKTAYMVVEDGWEDAPSEKLKYPVMEIKDGDLVYNKNGLLSAQQYAESDDKAVATKVKRIRKSLGLMDSEKKDYSAIISSAKERGLTCLGLFSGVLRFVEDCDTEDFKEKDKLKVLEMAEDKCEKEFNWDELTEKEVRLYDDDDDDDDDELDELRCERDELRMKCEKYEEEKKEMNRQRLKEDTDAILADADEDIDEKTKQDLAEMRDADKFATVEDFLKELSYRKYIKEKERVGTKTFSYSTFSISKTSTSGVKSILDALDEI